MKHFTEAQLAAARTLLADAQHQMGPFTNGQMRDLVLDTFDWVESREEADALLTAARPAGYSCTF